jgi:hypothetical protein
MKAAHCFAKSSAVTLALAAFILLGGGAVSMLGAQKPQHQGIKLQGFATVVTPDSITVFDKKSHVIEISTDKDYTSLVGIAVPITVWYTTKDGVNHLEDIVYPQSGTFVPGNQLQENIKRVAILPRPGDVDNSQGLISAISTYLTENAGWFVAPPELASEIASRAKVPTSPLDAIDSNTGHVDMQAYLEPQGALMTTIAQATHTDAVLEVKVIQVKANVRASIASWDDMTEPVASKAARTLSPFGQLESRGWVYAATADMTLWNQSGKVLWKKRRGFAVLAVQSGVASRYRPRPLAEVYENREAMQRWLADTLGPLAPPAAVVPAGQSQKQPERTMPAGGAQK